LSSAPTLGTTAVVHALPSHDIANDWSVPALLYVPTATHEVGDVQDTDTRMATEDATDGVVRTVHEVPSQAIAKASKLVLSAEAPTATHEVVEIQETE
jgi:hypothetical protein